MNRTEEDLIAKRNFNYSGPSGSETMIRFLLIPVFLCLGILYLFTTNVSAQEQEKTVRVGYYFSHNFQEGTDDTSPKSGYSYEYLQKLASYTGWKYEYVYGEWDELFEKLTNGEIDIMAGIAYSAERSSLINYPDNPILNETFYIYKDQNDTSMQCGNIDSYKGKKIGTLKNDQRMTAALKRWKENNLAKPIIESELLKTLGEIWFDNFFMID